MKKDLTPGYEKSLERRGRRRTAADVEHKEDF
jgi:hypothetical protein